MLVFILIVSPIIITAFIIVGKYLFANVSQDLERVYLEVLLVFAISYFCLIEAFCAMRLRLGIKAKRLRGASRSDKIIAETERKGVRLQVIHNKINMFMEAGLSIQSVNILILSILNKNGKTLESAFLSILMLTAFTRSVLWYRQCT